MDHKTDADIEKHPGSDSLFCEEGTGAVTGSGFEHGNSLYAKFQRLAGKLKVEQRGIERVPEDERNDHSYFNIGSMVNSYVSFLCLAVVRILMHHSGWPPIWLSHRSRSASWENRSLASSSRIRLSSSSFSIYFPRLLFAFSRPSDRHSACDRWSFRDSGLDGGVSRSVRPCRTRASLLDRCLTKIVSCDIQLPCLCWMGVRQHHRRGAIVQRRQ